MNSIQNHKWLLIGIETKVRELEANTFLACIAAEAGFDVLIGKFSFEDMKYLPRGILLDKTANSKRPVWYKAFKNQGFKIVSWDEEGLVYLDEIYKGRVSQEAISYLDHFFCWGESQYKLVRESIDQSLRDKILIMGHPRVDLLRPEIRELFADQVGSIQEKYQNFILINTNFGKSNHHYKTGEQFIETLKGNGTITSLQQEQFFLDWLEYDRGLLVEFQRLAIKLCEQFPNVNIIIRPHPSENFDFWRRSVHGLANAHVVHEGSVVPWLLATQALIHNSCTTAVESYVLGKIPYAYTPMKDRGNLFDVYLPNALSIPASNLDELFGLIEAEMTNNLLIPEDERVKREELAHTYLSCLEGEFSAEKIVRILKQIPIHSQGFRHRGFYRSFRFYRKFRNTIKSMLVSGNTLGVQYEKQKFSGLDKGEMQNLLQKFQNLTGRFQKVKIDVVSDSFFHVYQRKSDL